MRSNETQPTRRSMLKATGAALGTVGLMAASGQAFAQRMCLRRTTSVYEECPPTDFAGPVVEEGAEAFEACTLNGTQYYYVADADSSGYVPSYEVEPC